MPNKKKYNLNELDHSLIEKLREDPLVSHLKLATQLGVAQTTVASRIARLEQNQISKVIAITDMEAAGYPIYAIIGIVVKAKQLNKVAKALSALPNALLVSSVLGRYDIFASVMARDTHELHKILARDIGAIRGIESTEVHFILEIVNFSYRYAWLSPENQAPDIQLPTVDDIDQAIIQKLHKDGRTSNRSIARSIGFSEGTVRARKPQLLDKGLVKLVTICNPVALGTNAVAWAFINTEHGKLLQVANEIRQLPELAFAGITGSGKILICITVDDRAELSQFLIEQLLHISGVKRVETMEAVRVYKHDTRWCVANLHN